MEFWQREHINRNYCSLLQATQCDIELVSRLREAGVLTQNEEKTLTCSHLSSQDKSSRLYDILITRSNSYPVLIHCLASVSQTSAVNILRSTKHPLPRYDLITYDKSHILARGQNGTIVYKGRFDKKDVAVKVLNSKSVNAEIAIQEVEFLRELEQHKNVVRFFMAEKQNDRFVIAMELCSITLKDQIRRKIIDIEAESILKKCTKGLVHLHKNNIIHGDIRPTNILLTATKQVKLSNFGLSKCAEGSSTSGAVISRGFEAKGWMAPEVTPRSGNEIIRKLTLESDIFSLGCVYWYTLSNGMHPFGEEFQRARYIIHRKPKHVPTVISGIWSGVILSMISMNPKDRPTTDKVLSTLWGAVDDDKDLNNNIIEDQKLVGLSNVKIVEKSIVENGKPTAYGLVDSDEAATSSLPERMNKNVMEAIQKFEMLATQRAGAINVSY